MSFEVMAKTMPMHHSSIPIEVVVLDSLQQTTEMLHEILARSILTEGWRRPRPRERLAMADNRQLLRSKDGRMAMTAGHSRRTSPTLINAF